jgi:hypothetical protein
MPSQRVESNADEGPQEADLARFGGDTRPCPKCRADVYDDAEWCHACGQVLSQPAKEQTLPVWAVITAAALIAGLSFLLLAR